MSLTRCTSSSSSLAQLLPRSSGSTGGPCPCGVDDISALRKQPLSVSATSVRPKPGDLQHTTGLRGHSCLSHRTMDRFRLD